MRMISCFRSLLIVLLMTFLSVTAFGQIGVGISVSFGPPALPVYAQPLCPAPGYLWTPGYWAWDPDFDDYYWVPGTWVLAPQAGFLWTPPWWGWGGDGFIFHEGYWGPVVGFYGGISYGFGYFGHGYEGGRWDHGQFYYNRSVNNINVTNIHNVYNTTVVNSTTVNRVSYNGGQGGITAQPTPQEEAAANQRHIPAVAAQTQQVQAARANTQLRASVNQGKPPIAATQKPGEMKGGGVEAAKEAGAPYHPPANRAAAQPQANAAAAHPENTAREHPVSQPTAPPVHARDLPPHTNTPVPTGNEKVDQNSQQQQQKLNAQQEKEHQKLAQQQDKEDQQLQKQQANQEKTQQMEQKHAQQTQQMEARHAQQQQQLQQRQAPPAHAQSRPPKGK